MVNMIAASRRRGSSHAQRFVNVLLREIEPPLLKLNRRVGELRPSPQLPAQIAGRDAEFKRGLS